MSYLKISLLLVLISCSISTVETNMTEGYEKAYFAGGCFWCMEPPFEDLQVIDQESQRRQVERVQAFKQSRDGDKASQALTALEVAAKGADNLMPKIIDAVKARATLGEICDVMRKTFGEYHAAG